MQQQDLCCSSYITNQTNFPFHLYLSFLLAHVLITKPLHEDRLPSNQENPYNEHYLCNNWQWYTLTELPDYMVSISLCIRRTRGKYLSSFYYNIWSYINISVRVIPPPSMYPTYSLTYVWGKDTKLLLVCSHSAAVVASYSISKQCIKLHWWDTR